MQISKYFASLSIEVSQSSVKKADKALDHIENRLRKLGTFTNKPIVLSIGNFDVDQRKLNFALGNALDMASERLVFEVSHFIVNQAALNRSMGSALNRASATQSAHVNQRSGAARAAGAAVGGGLIGRGVSGLYGPALALGLGGYGLGSLNKRNQEIQAAQLTTEAVVTAGGMAPGSGTEAFSWLRNLANKTGFSYMDAADQYNSFLSNSLGMGKSLGEGQQMFKGISEYSRVMHVDPARQKLIFKAFTDMMGKGTVQSEELKKQLGNSLPGALSIFGEAFQMQTGGKLKGQDAVTALFDAMGKGKLKSSELLPIVTRLMEQKAAPTIEHASHTSQSEQDRLKNMRDDLVKVANESGVEEGFARIFRTLNAGLSESGDLVRRLSEGFNEATKWADDLLLFPQSFIRALEGKDSVVADWLGKDNIEQLKQDWKDIKQIFSDISAIKFDFLPDLKSTSEEVAKIMNAIAEFQRWKSGNLPSEQSNKSSTEKASFLGFEYASPAAIVGDIFTNTGFNMNKARVRGRAVYEDPKSPYYQNAELYDSNKDLSYQNYQNISAMNNDPTGQSLGDAIRTAEQEDQLSSILKKRLMSNSGMLDFSLNNTNGVGSSSKLFDDSENNKQSALEASQTVSNTQTNQFDITIQVDSATLAGMDMEQQAQLMADAFSNQLMSSFEQVSVNFPTKE